MRYVFRKHLKPALKNAKPILALAIVISFLTSAFAQSLQFGVSSATQNKDSTDLQSEVFIKLSKLSFKDSKLSFRVASNLATPIEAGLEAQYTIKFAKGPLGSMVGEVDLKGNVNVDSNGIVDIHASARVRRTALVTFEANFLLFNADQGHFSLESAYSSPVDSGSAYSSLSRPHYNTNNLSFGVNLEGTYTLRRKLVLEFRPTLILTSSSWGGYIKTAVQLRSFIGNDWGIIKLKAEKEPVTDDFYGAIGFEYRLRPKSQNWFLYTTVWLATGIEGTLPGGTLTFKYPIRPLKLELELAAEPYRIDELPYRASGLLALELAQGELQFRILGAPNNKSSLPEFAAQVGYSWEF